MRERIYVRVFNFDLREFYNRKEIKDLIEELRLRGAFFREVQGQEKTLQILIPEAISSTPYTDALTYCPSVKKVFCFSGVSQSVFLPLQPERLKVIS